MTNPPLGLEIRWLTWKEDSFRMTDQTIGWMDTNIPSTVGSSFQTITFANDTITTKGVFAPTASPIITNGDELILPEGQVGYARHNFQVGIPANQIALLRVRARTASAASATLTIQFLDNTSTPFQTITVTPVSTQYEWFSLSIIVPQTVYGIQMQANHKMYVDYVALGSMAYINQGGSEFDLTIPKKTLSQTIPNAFDIIQQLGIGSNSYAVIIPKVSIATYNWLASRLTNASPLEIVTPTKQATGYLFEVDKISGGGWVGKPIPTTDALAVTATKQQLYDINSTIVKTDTETNIDLSVPALANGFVMWSDSADNVRFWKGGHAPVTIDATGVASPTAYAEERKIWFANGLSWAFFYDGSPDFGFATSSDGVTWSATTSMGPFPGGFINLTNSPYALSTWVNGSTVYCAISATGFFAWGFIYRTGTLNSNGTITWAANWLFVSTGFAVSNESNIFLDSVGTLYAGTNTLGPQFSMAKSTNGGVVWTTISAISQGFTPYPPFIGEFPSNRIVVAGNNAFDLVVQWSDNQGSSWTSPSINTVMPPTTLFAQANFVIVGSTLYAVAAANDGNIYFWTFNNGALSWSSATLLAAGTYPTISTNSLTQLDVFYVSNAANTVSHLRSLDLGITWSPSFVVSSIEATPTFLCAPIYIT